MGRRKGSPLNKKSEALKKAEKATQFGQPGGNKPFGARDYHPMNMRAALRHFASQPLDPRKLTESYDALLGHHKFSGAEMAAYKRLHLALSGNSHELDRLEDALCGKVPDHHILEDKKKRPPGNPSQTLDEAIAALDEALKGEQ